MEVPVALVELEVAEALVVVVALALLEAAVVPEELAAQVDQPK
jgi:hypothetical protein